MKPSFLLCFSILFLGFLPWLAAQKLQEKDSFLVQLDSLQWLDEARNRSIPVAFYQPKTDKKIKNQIPVIFSHGYGANQPQSNLAYSFICNFLAEKGCFVASIQHELPSDSLLAMTGDFKITRRSNWERGVANILFVIKELKKIYPQLNYKKLVLIGHSNGGDMSMLFAQLYPDLLAKAISLDNRRVALPRTKKPQIYSLRAIDYPADPEVLPTAEEQKKYGIRVVKLSNILHGEMNDSADEAKRAKMKAVLFRFMNGED